jgi:hypothetical protein
LQWLICNGKSLCSRCKKQCFKKGKKLLEISMASTF